MTAGKTPALPEYSGAEAAEEDEPSLRANWGKQGVGFTGCSTSEECGAGAWGFLALWVKGPPTLVFCPVLPPSPLFSSFQGPGILLCEDDSLYEGTFTRELTLLGKVSGRPFLTPPQKCRVQSQG